MSDKGILQAIVLPSGLGVRYRDLTPKQGDAILEAAGKEIPPDATISVLLAVEAKLGYEAMVVQVTAGPCRSSPVLQKVKNPETGAEEPVKVGEEPDVNHPDNKWVAFDPDAESPFSNKDHSVLKSIYMARNKAAPGEVAAIMGKATPVAAS